VEYISILLEDNAPELIVEGDHLSDESLERAQARDTLEISEIEKKLKSVSDSPSTVTTTEKRE
jgi:hypothetical protein